MIFEQISYHPMIIPLKCFYQDYYVALYLWDSSQYKVVYDSNSRHGCVRLHAIMQKMCDSWKQEYITYTLQVAAAGSKLDL